MDGVSRHSWFRSVRSSSVTLLALIVLLGVGGFLLTSTTIRRDRDSAAERRARVEAVHAQEVLGRARAYVAGVADVLAREPEPGQARFARWAGATSASVGLNDVMWVERVASSERRRYERLHGGPITHLTASGRLVRAPQARSYLPATFTSRSRPELRPGVDVTGFPALASAIRDRARIFAVGASRPGALGGESGFYLLEAASFARGRGSRGYLVAFVPRGWFSTTLGGDPRRVAIREDGRRIEGQLASTRASAGFETLGRRWRIDVDREPPSGLQSMLPWLALAWPFAVAGIALAIVRATTLRRQAQRTADSRGAELQVRAAEQAALRRVATLVAREAAQPKVFSAIAEEIGQLLGTQILMLRYESDGSGVVMGTVGNVDVFPLGSRHKLEGDSAAGRVLRTERTARIDDYRTASGPLADRVRGTGTRSAVGAPIFVEGRLWGAVIAGSTQHEVLPPDTEPRLGEFTELMATAIANTESRARADRLGDEQAALRRVATLVARAVAPSEVFAAVSREVGLVLGVEWTYMARYESDDMSIGVAGWGPAGDEIPVGTRISLEGESVGARVLRTGRSARMHDYEHPSGDAAELGRERGLRSAVGAPILVDQRLWGVMIAAAKDDGSLPLDAESRLEQFTELVATAISNADARAEVERLAEEQAALRRVATLAAEGGSANAVFDAVAAEMERLLRADTVTVSRYEPAGEVTVVAHRGSDARRVPPGTGVAHDAPIVVDGRLWGVVIASWRSGESPPTGTEVRMAQFAQLLDIAIASADSREQLTASRTRLVTAFDEARRRVVRDLHDGAQQRLVHTIVTLKLAREALRDGNGEVEPLVGEALEHAQQSNAELRELALGILPAALARGGLRVGVDAVVSRLDLPVRVDLPAERFPAEIEASAYFIVAEALTNVVKHAHAERAEITASVRNGTFHLEVRDDGIGGADPKGHGLVGLRDRATALGGRLEVASPDDGGTVVTATLPLPA
jgi:signal transduction histidine kinase